MHYSEIGTCRLCDSGNLPVILDLGNQYLSGIFLETKTDIKALKAPLQLTLCPVESGGCGLAQLKHTVNLDLNFGQNYGYKSGLNPSMSSHLNYALNDVLSRYGIESGKFLDIGSNDGTLLNSISDSFEKFGVDPNIDQFIGNYGGDVLTVCDFFPSSLLNEKLNGEKFSVISSFSILYDLPKPLEAFHEVSRILDPINGIWVIEQSHLPSMVDNLAFDTICHEHLEYYSLSNIKKLCDLSNLKIVDFELNDINGGSIRIICCHKDAKFASDERKISEYLDYEKNTGVGTVFYLEKFASAVREFAKNLNNQIDKLISKNIKIYAFGASTKGNVLLQYCNLDNSKISAIGEINEDKFGKITPGSWIPILPENEIFDINAVYLILPWHFRKYFENTEKYKNLKLLFPLKSK